MKAIKDRLRPITWLLAVVMVFQSCTVYKSTPITIDEASKANDKVRIYKRNGEKLKYYRIVQGNDGKYYGDQIINKMHNNFLINEDEIEKIQIKDKSTSTILTIAIPVAIIGIAIGAVALTVQNSIGFSY
jgi:CHASE3 domain sensor protein